MGENMIQIVNKTCKNQVDSEFDGSSLPDCFPNTRKCYIGFFGGKSCTVLPSYEFCELK